MSNLQQTKVKKKNKKRKRDSAFFLMMLPGLTYLFVNNYIPMTGVIIAFKELDFSVGILKSKFVGLKNFTYLFQTQDAWLITRNTLLYNFAFIVLGTLCAITVAILLNEITVKWIQKVYQTTILLPALISIVVVSYLVFALLSADNGFINNTILNALGKEAVSWYTEPRYWPIILIVVNLWKGFGFNCIIYYATLISIDRSYYEAASVDGASRWQQLINITLPGLKQTVFTMTLLSIGKIFYSDFGLFYQVPMNSGMLQNATNTIDTYVYRAMSQLNDMGMASAAGLYQSLVGFVLVLAANKIVNRYSGSEGIF
ncbi:MAG TPA: sugar ABC transporter permease [Clostridiales bacterium]|nr:sugar ABC transporter permease [Clostridiales bacterium]